MSAKFNEEAWTTVLPFSLYLVHKLISIHVNCDLDHWPPKSIGSILSLGLTCVPSLMSSSNQQFSFNHVHKLFTIHVNCDLDLWPPKSIGSILSLWLTCLPSLIKSTQRFSIYHVHKPISIYVNCDLDLWPLTPKIKTLKGSSSRHS